MMTRAGWAFAASLVSATAAAGQVSHVLPAMSPSVKEASVEAFPAQFVARQIQAALADPRNVRYLDEAERLVWASEIVAPAVEPEAAPNLGAAEPVAPPRVTVRAASALKERLADSWDRVTVLATQVREAMPTAGLWFSSPWGAWTLAGALLVLLMGRRFLSRPSENRSLRTARKLARRGILPGEVARRTGLSQDVIRLVDVRRKRREVA